MSKLGEIRKYLLKPKLLLLKLDQRRIITLPDKSYLNILYEITFKRRINWKNPQTFNEKLQWLKIYNRNPEYTKMVDKYEAKEYVANIIGKEYIIPTLGIYDKFDDIDFEKLPNQFVLKCTHDSGGLVICKDKKTLDVEKSKRTINKSLKKNYYFSGREWPYKNVKPRIIAEEYMKDNTGGLLDYKVYAFNGKCDYLMTCIDRDIGEVKFIYYDAKWNIKKEFSKDGIKYGDTIKLERPKQLDKMFEFAKILSKDIPFVRVDFYEVNGKLYFGELTFFPSSGFDNDRTIECQNYLDKMLKI